MATASPGRAQSAGLKWRKRTKGADVPYWFATSAAIDKGYPVKAVNLGMFADDERLLVSRCKTLQAEMNLWLAGRFDGPIFQDGMFKPIFDLYETDPESTYRSLKVTNKPTYNIYLKKLRSKIGHLYVNEADGRDIKRWFAEWRRDEDGSDHLPRAHMMLSVLKAAMKFAVICRVAGAAEFQALLKELEFESPASRTFAPTVAQVIAARKAAHAAGAPERALLYSLQHETQARQWDIIGQWFALSDPRPSDVLGHGKKWFGLKWSAIDQNLILRLTPTKTEDTTEVSSAFDLSVCPMVMEDLAHFPAHERVGPVIKNPKTGLPYMRSTFEAGWKADFRAAGLPAGMWNRDLRAGGVTENRRAGASKDDVRQIAGHSQEKTTDIYDRDKLEAHRRVMAARKIKNA